RHVAFVENVGGTRKRDHLHHARYRSRVKNRRQNCRLLCRGNGGNRRTQTLYKGRRTLEASIHESLVVRLAAKWFSTVLPFSTVNDGKLEGMPVCRTLSKGQNGMQRKASGFKNNSWGRQGQVFLCLKLSI